MFFSYGVIRCRPPTSRRESYSQYLSGIREGALNSASLTLLHPPANGGATYPEFPFWDQERHHSTPVWPVRDTVKRFFIGSTPDGLPAAAAQPKIASFVAYFCNTSPYPNQVIDGFPC